MRPCWSQFGWAERQRASFHFSSSLDQSPPIQLEVENFASSARLKLCSRTKIGNTGGHVFLAEDALVALPHESPTQPALTMANRFKSLSQIAGCMLQDLEAQA